MSIAIKTQLLGHINQFSEIKHYPSSHLFHSFVQDSLFGIVYFGFSVTPLVLILCLAANHDLIMVISVNQVGFVSFQSSLRFNPDFLPN